MVSGVIAATTMILFLKWQTILGEWIVMVIMGAATFTVVAAANVCIILVT